ncbi:hypothetical protein MDG893_05119 [Marinobacter algicola DG893]|uniref:Uncharacterized protein n=1 Tax=Marinobacter algicola DG893 TaxID=443152 RepID=A6F4U2_9GAMM|nr:hypothetical protein MDG893_05119 [Marinobacter algicola DG893]
MTTLTIELPDDVTAEQIRGAADSLGCDLRLDGDGKNLKAVPRKPTNVVRMPTRIREVHQPSPGSA